MPVRYCPLLSVADANLSKSLTFKNLLHSALLQDLHYVFGHLVDVVPQLLLSVSLWTTLYWLSPFLCSAFFPVSYERARTSEVKDKAGAKTLLDFHTYFVAQVRFSLCVRNHTFCVFRVLCCAGALCSGAVDGHTTAVRPYIAKRSCLGGTRCV